MFTDALRLDSELRARIILNHPKLYTRERVQQARAVLEKSPIPNPAGTPLVSVILATFNRPRLMIKALESLMDQSLSDVEVIVVNDGGIDVVPWLNGVAKRLSIRHVKHKRHQGVAAARNTGLRLARGDYIAYLEDGDVFHPDHLSTLVKAAETSGRFVVHSNAWETTSICSGGMEVIERRAVWTGNSSPAELLVRNSIPTPCLLHRRACVDRTGGFDESLSACEHWDMWIRLANNFPFEHVAQTTCEYLRGGAADPLSEHRGSCLYHSLKVIYKKYKCSPLSNKAVRRAQKHQRYSMAREMAAAGQPVEAWGKMRCFAESLREGKCRLASVV